MFPSFDAQSTSKVVDTSAGNNPSSLPLEAEPPNAAGLGTPNAKATSPTETSTDNAEGTSQDGDSATEGLFPDGRIFLEGGPPYGYIPTCTPKGPSGIPMIPLEPGE